MLKALFDLLASNLFPGALDPESQLSQQLGGQSGHIS